MVGSMVTGAAALLPALQQQPASAETAAVTSNYEPMAVSGRRGGWERWQAGDLSEGVVGP